MRDNLDVLVICIRSFLTLRAIQMGLNYLFVIILYVHREEIHICDQLWRSYRGYDPRMFHYFHSSGVFLAMKYAAELLLKLCYFNLNWGSWG